MDNLTYTRNPFFLQIDNVIVEPEEIVTLLGAILPGFQQYSSIKIVGREIAEAKSRLRGATRIELDNDGEIVGESTPGIPLPTLADDAMIEARLEETESWKAANDPATILANFKISKNAELTEYLKGVRLSAAGVEDEAKLAVYNQRAQFAREIMNDTATDAMNDTAKSEMVRLGLAANEADADPKVIAAVWVEKDGDLGLLSAVVDKLETETRNAVDGAADIDGAITAYDDGVASIDAAVAGA